MTAADGAATTEPVAATPLTDRDGGAAAWALARERLEHPELPRTYWLATVRPDGAPHLMPIIGAWFDEALHFLCGPGTRKGRNLAAEPRCVIGTGSTTLPSLDLILEGLAVAITDPGELERVTERFRDATTWPLEVRDGGVHGPNAPTAGPPPYNLFRLAPTTVFGLPGMAGMEQFDPEELPRPTRWRF